VIHRFDSVYAAHLGGTAECAERYSAICVSSNELSFEEANVLGEGAFGKVFGGELHPRATRQGQPRAAWRALRISPNTEENMLTLATSQGDGGAPTRDTSVAIKVAQTTDDSALAQLLLEARLLANMDNPHIARVLAVQDKHLPVQVAMELCRLGNLRDFLRKGGITVLGSVAAAAMRARLAAHAAEGLAYIHGRSCIHRDIAARNMLLSRDANDGIVLKLGDLGLARGIATTSDYYRVRWARSVM
jgi:serine/threonine protein kinase